MQGLAEILDSTVNETVVKVSCGANFTVALTSAGNVCTWGWGANGVLGRGSKCLGLIHIHKYKYTLIN